ncbi:putative baseplate assembly protein [Geodermatophilus sp. SYSU D00758]
MSRPPNPRSARSPVAGTNGDPGRLDYLPQEYADLLALQQDLAVPRLGRPRPDTDAAEAPDGGQSGDLAWTFMDLSALLGHVLAVYQRHHAREAFISTARAPSSLVRHAHRLGHDPDPGLAASGHVVLFTKAGVGGSVAAGLALASTPLGELATQDYETRDDVVVDAALNEMVPLDARKPVTVAAAETQLRVRGVGHRLRAGDVIALVAPPQWRGFVVTDFVEEPSAEDPAGDATLLRLDREVGAALGLVDVRRAVVLAHPHRVLRAFAADADPALFPPAAVRAATDDKPQEAPRYWYAVHRPDGTGHVADDVYLGERVDDPLAGGHVLRGTGADAALLEIVGESEAGVTLHREAEEELTTHTVTLTPTDDGGFTTTLDEVTVTQLQAGHVSGTVTAVQVAGRDGAPIPRAQHPLPVDWYAHWSASLALADATSSTELLTEPLRLPGFLPAMTPGRPLVFRDRAGTVAQVVTVRRAELDDGSDLGGKGETRIWWDPVTPPPPPGWRLHDLVVHGNVVRVSHGRTVREVLGGSDGVTPFQRFPLREKPVTVLPGPTGGEPELTIRVDGVRWTRVADFADSGPDDRHYRSVSDEAAGTTVVFGDGRNGAVPPSGRRNVEAAYRVGLGRAGNVEPRRLSRLTRAHPLLARAVNLTPVHGGAEPADPEAVRTQATRFLRTFDRAVSVADLADLALTMPGIARTAARRDGAQAAVLVVATADGVAPPALDAVRAFLDARRDVTVPLALRGPQPRDVLVSVTVEPDPAHLAEEVRDRVRRALHGGPPGAPGLFTFASRALGQPAYLSEVLAVLEAVPGVVGVRVTRFVPQGHTGVADVVSAGVEEWLRLLPNNLAVNLAGGAP